MNVQLEPGTYVLAISGGVDSMVMLNMLSKLLKMKLVVAHFDHGIRPDSQEDRLLVQVVAAELGLPFVFHEGRLGERASEDAARQARYDFLRAVQAAAEAKAIVTAHHQDDALETAIHHLLRGTGRKGLSSLQQNPDVLRPLIHMTKDDLRKYAKTHDIKWREDSTNDDIAYTRNYIRHQIIPKLTEPQKKQLLDHVLDSQKRNSVIDNILQDLLNGQTDKLDRQWFIGLPHGVAREVMATWLRQREVREFDRKLIEHLVVASKTQRVNSYANVNKAFRMHITKQHLALVPGER